MAKVIKRLTALKIERVTDAGYHPDGDDLYLQVSARGSKSWIFGYTLDGRAREMGLGSLKAVSLEKARRPTL